MPRKKDRHSGNGVRGTASRKPRYPYHQVAGLSRLVRLFAISDWNYERIYEYNCWSAGRGNLSLPGKTFDIVCALSGAFGGSLALSFF